MSFLFTKLNKANCPLSFVISLFVVIMALSACSPVQHGYKTEENTAEVLQKMVNEKWNINRIIATMGSPSFVNTPINDTICYVDANGKKIAFNRFYKPTYKFICIVFEKQIAKELKTWTLQNIEKAKMTKYNTSFKKPL